MPRKRYPTISKGADGLWHAWVTVGTKPTGRPDQRHVKRATKEEAEERVDELLDQRRAGTVTKPGRAVTLQQWMTVYLDTVAPRRCDPSTIYDYRSKCTHWVYPVCGRIRLDQLAPEHLDAVYLGMQRARKAPSSILKTHRILSRALEIAYRRGLIARNVAKLIDSPTASRVEMKPLTLDEARRVLAAAADRPSGARWSIGLALGLRQGETLGLRWEYVDLDAAELRVWWQLRRRVWLHGCSPPCGRRRGGNCPDRTLDTAPGDVPLEGALVLKEPKGGSRRTVPLPAELVTALRAHRRRQAVMRLVAGPEWRGHDLVFCHADGAPIDPGSDYDDWRDLLAEAGVPGKRVHDGRHTAGTLMLLHGVDIRTVQEILGHSDVRVTQGYTHVASGMAQEAARRIGAALFGG